MEGEAVEVSGTPLRGHRCGGGGRGGEWDPPHSVTGVEGEAMEASGTSPTGLPVWRGRPWRRVGPHCGVTGVEGEAVEVSGTPPRGHRRGGGGCGGEWDSPWGH